MNRKSCGWVLMCAVVIVSCMVTVQGGAASLYYFDKVAGTFHSAVIDVDGDGVPGTVGNLEGRSSYGAVTIQFFSEFDLLGREPSENCPDGFVEVPVVSSSSVHVFQNASMLMLKTTEEVMCGDPLTGEFFWNETLEILGGTGMFEGAEGTLKATGKGSVLEADAFGVTSFGPIQMETKGRIHLNRP